MTDGVREAIVIARKLQSQREWTEPLIPGRTFGMEEVDSRTQEEKEALETLINFSQTAQNQVDKLQEENKRLREAVETGLKEMILWKSVEECDCPPEGHICGIARLNNSIFQAQQALRLTEGNTTA